MEKYFIVLFKNKKRQRIIKKFITKQNAESFFSKLIKKSDNVIFEVKFENGSDVTFELGLLTKELGSSTPVYLTDEMGRNIKVRIDDPDLIIEKIVKYKKEDLIYDIKSGEKITISEFIQNELKSKNLKMISILNNKLIVQEEENFKLFSLKNESDCERFIESISNEFLTLGRTDCLFIKDSSSAQRKYLFDLLEKNGFDKKILYRKSTTHPRLK